MIELEGADGFHFGAYHVDAEGPRKGGLVLVQEIFGVTTHIKEQADRFAKVGYEVIAPSLYDRIERGFQCDYSEDGIKRALEIRGQNSLEDGIGDVDACRAALAGNGKVFVAGYCFGGSLTWIAAARLPGFAAGSAYYGRLIPDHVDELPQCPVICHFGEHDGGIPMELVIRFNRLRKTIPTLKPVSIPPATAFNRTAAATITKKATSWHGPARWNCSTPIFRSRLRPGAPAPSPRSHAQSVLTRAQLRLLTIGAEFLQHLAHLGIGENAHAAD
jgi:carboxymethylenebutenolidase